MTKKEKAILKLAQKWAKARHRASHASGEYRYNAGRRNQRKDCGRALLKILEP